MPHDFSQHSLRQKSFVGQNLTGANFTGADIRGADFSGACLINANFSHAKAGLPPLLAIRLIAFTIFLALLSGLITAYAGAVFGHLFTDSESSFQALGVSVAIALFLFGITTFRKGLGFALALATLIAATAIVATVAITPSISFAGETVLSSLTLGGAIAGVVGLATAINLSGFIKLTLAANLLGIVVGSLLGISQDEILASSIGVIPISVSVLGLAAYIGKQASRGEQRYLLIYRLTINIRSAGSTRFYTANLTNANFTGALLSSTDFREANLLRVCWLRADLESANIEHTYLENLLIRKLLTTGQGCGKNFDRLDLRGINLQNANLADASLIGTDLSNATLQGANLSRTKLVQAQLYGTNLAGAYLTGAYIQNWGISPETNLEAVKCDYIYMHLPSDEDPDPYRKPDNRRENFRDGDFVDFIAPIIRALDTHQQQNLDPRMLPVVSKTLDLYHYEGINPSAAVIALQELANQYPEAHIEVIAIEGHGDQKIRLQAQVASAVDQSQLNTTYFDNYDKLKTLSDADLQALLTRLEEADTRIRSLESMVENTRVSNHFYIETYQQQGELIMTQNKGNVSISNGQGNVSGVAVAGENQEMTGVALGEISGSVTNTINQLVTSSDPDRLEIRELLTQLQAAIEAETGLSNEDKVEALKQAKTLAEVGQHPQNTALKKAAKTAVKILKGTASSLPESAKLAEACTKLLPIISKVLLLT